MSNSSGQVRLDVDGAIADVVLNRPDKLNSLDDSALAAMRAVFEDPGGRPDR